MCSNKEYISKTKSQHLVYNIDFIQKQERKMHIDLHSSLFRTVFLEIVVNTVIKRKNE